MVAHFYNTSTQEVKENAELQATLVYCTARPALKQKQENNYIQYNLCMCVIYEVLYTGKYMYNVRNYKILKEAVDRNWLSKVAPSLVNV